MRITDGSMRTTASAITPMRGALSLRTFRGPNTRSVINTMPATPNTSSRYLGR
jgi:hypothetical protein